MMHPHPGQRALARVRSPLHWQVWGLPFWLSAVIVAVVALYASLVLFAATLSAAPTVRQALLLGGLLLCGAATVELTRRAGENAGFISDIYAVWELPVAVLLPPVYAMVAPLVRISLAQWRVRPLPLHRRVFTAAAVGLSYGAASLVFHGMGFSLGFSDNPWTGAVLWRGSLWLAAVAAAGVTQWAVNIALILPAVKGSDPGARLRDAVLSREVVQNDIAELCVAVLVTAALSVSTLTLLFALPLVTLLQRSSRHAQLLNASRLDSKTGVLNAGTWEREAAAEVARAVRTRTPLALALIDIDHFKAVNDTYGHLVGDQALKAIARTFKIFVRQYDVVGRFGGEEFCLLLPQTRAVDAYRIAERVREHIAAMPIEAGDADPVRVTVSMGVAALGVGWDRHTTSQLTDLLAAADRALYQAKRGGRDQVCMITEMSMTTSRPTEVATADAVATADPSTAGNSEPS